MAIAQAICNSFKTELLGGIHDLDTDVFKIALFRATGSIVGTFGAATTNYSNMGADEATGTGYAAGGQVLTGAVLGSGSNVSWLDFADAVWSGLTLTARGALIYNSSKANRAVAIWDFGADKIVVDGMLTVQFPAPDAANALLRLA